MLILICKDSATQVPRHVKDLEEAQALAANLGMPVLVQTENGAKVPLEEFFKLTTKPEEGAKPMEDAVYVDSRLPLVPAPKPEGVMAKAKTAVKRAVTRKK